MNLVLIGYRGTGKSSVGAEMSELLSWPVISTDELICEKAGNTIPEIVKAYGWDYFRDLETSVIMDVTKKANQIIDTGGGAILRPQNLDALKKNGLLVWLKASVKTIQARIFDNNERPSLTKEKSFIDEVEEVLKDRIPIYSEAADLEIDTDDRAVDEICSSIIAFLKERHIIS